MAGRYLITGVQLGLLKSLNLMKDTKEVDEQLDGILDKQFLGTSKNSIEEDIKEWKEKLWQDKP